MDRVQLEQLKRYGAQLAIMRRLLHRKLINKSEYQKLKTALRQRERISLTGDTTVFPIKVTPKRGERRSKNTQR